MEQPNYEFTDSQNQTISLLARRMKWVVIFFIAMGAAFGLVGVVGLVESEGALDLILKPIIFMMIAAIFFLSGIWTVNAAKSFSLIVKTTGSDVLNLMNGLEVLLKLYYMQFWLVIDSLVVLVIAFVVLVAMGLF